ncbi:MAG: hypothetical protein N2234_08695 [Planctomycetota bacterium]|nr:hypothetical protein [Planctomycetota bacterium]
MRRILSVLTVLFASASLFGQEKPSLSGSVDEEMRRLRNAIEAKNWLQGLDAANTILLLIKSQKEEVKKSLLADVRYYRGLCLLNIGDLKEAAKDFNETTKADENYLDAYIGLALIFNRESNHVQAKRELERVVARGYPVREIQKYPELCAYLLESLSFFIFLTEKELEFIVKAKEDPFICPLRKPEGGKQPVEAAKTLPVAEQIRKLVEFKARVDDLQQRLKEEDQEGAARSYSDAKKFYEETVSKMDGERKMEMERLWENMMKKFAEEVLRIRVKAAENESNKLLDELKKAYTNRKIEEGLKVYKKIEELPSQMEALEDEIRKSKQETAPLIEKLRTIKETLRREAARLYERILIIKEFNENILPLIRFSGVVETKDGPVILLEMQTPAGTVSESLREGEEVEGFQGLFVGTYNRLQEELVLNYKNEPLRLKLKVEGE